MKTLSRPAYDLNIQYDRYLKVCKYACKNRLSLKSVLLYTKEIYAALARVNTAKIYNFEITNSIISYICRYVQTF